MLADSRDNFITLSRRLFKHIQAHAGKANVFVFRVRENGTFGFTLDHPFAAESTQLCDIQYNGRYRCVGFETLCPSVGMMFYEWGLPAECRVRLLCHVPKDKGWDCLLRDRQARLLYLYYPNSNAYKAVVQYGTAYYEVKLTAHDLLNGAYYFSGWDGIVSDERKVSAPIASSNEDRLVEIKNAIYTSEISNPFYFPTTGINTVGVGTIIGISSAAKALSQGQFGEFPLYAFCSDGVWALSVSSDGGYSAIQPITRDVCINTDSITQIDSAVLFATNRGIMLIVGSEVKCISESLKSEDIFSLTDLPRHDKLLQVYNGKADESEQLTVEDIDMLPFLDFVSGCQMVYDYTNQHIIIYNPSVHHGRRQRIQDD